MSVESRIVNLNDRWRTGALCAAIQEMRSHSNQHILRTSHDQFTPNNYSAWYFIQGLDLASAVGSLENLLTNNLRRI